MSAFLEGISFLGRETLRIVLPSACVVCRGELPWRARAASCCAPCWRDLPRLEGVRCRRCAAAWPGAPEGADFLCLHCAAVPSDPIDRIDAWGEYQGGLERLLVAFKFERHDFLDAPLAELLLQAWAARGDADVEAVAAVPMHPRKMRARGYNQAALLARKFASASGLPFLPVALSKVRESEPQSTLHRDERALNVKGAFQAAACVAGADILLIDDICTTGATLRACAKAMRRAGAERVVGLTVARA